MNECKKNNKFQKEWHSATNMKYEKLPTQKSWVWAERIRLQEGKLMPENFPAVQFLRKADKRFDVCIVN